MFLHFVTMNQRPLELGKEAKGNKRRGVRWKFYSKLKLKPSFLNETMQESCVEYIHEETGTREHPRGFIILHVLPHSLLHHDSTVYAGNSTMRLHDKQMLLV